MGNFQKLAVYERAVEIADEIRDVSLTWDSFDRWTLGIQLVRSADSIGANLAEGSGRQTDRDQLRFLLIARGSAAETEHWLERAQVRNLITDPSLLAGAREVSRMLNGLITTVRARTLATGD